MPKATVSKDTTDKIFLKSCPDGFIMLRRLSYGEYLKRQEMAIGMAMASGGSGKDAEMAVTMAQRATQEFEFANCIVEHNLEDDDGNPMDFKRSATIDILDPKIGQEISSEIDKLTQFEDDLKN